MEGTAASQTCKQRIWFQTRSQCEVQPNIRKTSWSPGGAYGYTMKKVHFFPWVEVQPIPYEDRRGMWAIDGQRFRDRIQHASEVIEPVLQKRLAEMNHVNVSYKHVYTT